jgi:hypothetical protein
MKCIVIKPYETISGRLVRRCAEENPDRQLGKSYHTNEATRCCINTVIGGRKRNRFVTPHQSDCTSSVSAIALFEATPWIGDNASALVGAFRVRAPVGRRYPDCGPLSSSRA